MQVRRCDVRTRCYCLLLILIASVVLSSATAAMGQTPPGAAAQIAPSSQTGTPTNINTYYSRGALTVAIVALCVVTVLFLLLLKYQHRLEQSGYLVTIYRESVEDNEFKRLSSQTHERFTDGYYHKQVQSDSEWQSANQPPAVPAIAASLGTRNPMRPAYLTPPPGSAPEVLEIVTQYNGARSEWENKLDAEARRRYDNELAGWRTKAAQRAKNAVGDVDFSALQGRGAEFVLGFTTIASIVFAALALGVLKILNSEQIGTLFAAIAGYVLGRATTRGSQPQSAPPPAAEPVDKPAKEAAKAKAVGQGSS